MFFLSCCIFVSFFPFCLLVFFCLFYLFEGYKGDTEDKGGEEGYKGGEMVKGLGGEGDFVTEWDEWNKGDKRGEWDEWEKGDKRDKGVKEGRKG